MHGVITTFCWFWLLILGFFERGGAFLFLGVRWRLCRDTRRFLEDGTEDFQSFQVFELFNVEAVVDDQVIHYLVSKFLGD